MSSENNERAMSPEIQTIQLDEVGVDDTIVLETATGSVYNLKIIEIRNGSPWAVMDRQSGHAVVGSGPPTDTGDSLKFNVLGSCDRGPRSYGGAELKPLHPIDGQIEVGKLARFLSETGEQMVTSTIKSIQLVKDTNGETAA